MSIEDDVATLKKTVAEHAAVIASLRAALGGGGATNGRSNGNGHGHGPAIATDYEMSGKYGDPAVKFSPRAFTGGTLKGRPMSQCPPEGLDALAEAFDEFAVKNDRLGAVDAKGKPKGDWDRKSAKLARGWAARIRSGWKPPVQEPTSFGGPASSGGFADDGGFAAPTMAEVADDYDGDVPFIIDASRLGWERP